MSIYQVEQTPERPTFQSVETLLYPSMRRPGIREKLTLTAEDLRLLENPAAPVASAFAAPIQRIYPTIRNAETRVNAALSVPTADPASAVRTAESDRR